MQTIRDLSNKLTEMLNTTRNKADYAPIISEIDQFIVGQIPILEKEDSINLYRLPTDVRLELAEENRKNAEVNPIVGINNSIRYLCDNYYEAGKQLGLGWFKELNFENGFFNAVIHPKISVDFGDENKVSNVQKFERQVEEFKDKGYDLIHCKFSKQTVMYAPTENNMKLLKALLEDVFDARLIEFSLNERGVDEIKFCFLPLAISPKQTEVIADSELLSDDNIAYIVKSLKELLFAYATIGDKAISLDSTLNTLVQYCFKNICEVFGFETVISKRVTDYHRNERNKNFQIRELENEMAAKYDISNMKADIETLSNNLERKVFSNTYWTTHSFEISKYGVLSAEMRFSPFRAKYLSCVKNIKITDEMVFAKYSTNGGRIEAEDIMVLDTLQNREVLEDSLRQAVPSAEILNIISRKERNQYYIQKVEIVINSVSDLL